MSVSTIPRALCQAYNARRLLLLEAYLGRRRPNHASEYRRLTEELENYLESGRPLSSPSILSFGGGPLASHSFRLGQVGADLSADKRRTISGVTKLARGNTDFIMDLKLISNTFQSLRASPSLSLRAVEEQATALAKSLTVSSIPALIEYAVGKPSVPSIQVEEDSAVLKRRRLELFGEFVKLLTVTQEELLFFEGFNKSFAAVDSPEGVVKAYGALVKDLLELKIQPVVPMQPSPLPPNFSKHYTKKVPPPYDSTPIQAEYEALVVEKRAIDAMQGDEKVKAATAFAAKEQRFASKQLDFARAAVDYWEAVFSIAMKRRAIELAYMEETEFSRGGQAEEANRVLHESMKSLQAIAPHLVKVALLVAGYVQAKDYDQSLRLQVQSTIKGGLDAFLKRATNGVVSEGSTLLFELLPLPKNKSSVGSYFSSIGIPEQMATWFGEAPKRDLLKATAAWLIYSSM